MASAKSKRHIQQDLFRRGGKRRRAGRKPVGARAGERHEARPDLKPYHPLHVVMRVDPAVGSCAGQAAEDEAGQALRPLSELAAAARGPEPERLRA